MEKKIPGVMSHSGRHRHAETGDLLWPEINRCQAAVMWEQHRRGETEVDKVGKKQVITLYTDVRLVFVLLDCSLLCISTNQPLPAR